MLETQQLLAQLSSALPTHPLTLNGSLEAARKMFNYLS